MARMKMIKKTPFIFMHGHKAPWKEAKKAEALAAHFLPLALLVSEMNIVFLFPRFLYRKHKKEQGDSIEDNNIKIRLCE